MRKILYTIIFIGIIVPVFAGNQDRIGSAGASELLINPWARSTGWGSVNTANVFGSEAIFGNIAGIAFIKSTEISFAHTIYFKGADIGINSVGFCQRVSKSGVLSLGIMSMNFGDIPITTTDNANDTKTGLGTYSPKYMNINLGYAKSFSNSIYGGINFKIINEAISDVNATGIALDAGIQYITGEKENIKFGITLKNIGTKLKYSGSGLSVPSNLTEASYSSTMNQRAEAFELPSLVKIGFAYDFQLVNEHTLTGAINFTPNSFSKDQYSLGLEYGYKSVLFLRAGFTYENGLFSKYNPIDPKTTRTTPYTGPSAGVSVDIPLNKEKGTKFSFDYSYRSTDPFQGNHAIGARLSF